jgi:hypothetical protein
MTSIADVGRCDPVGIAMWETGVGDDYRRLARERGGLVCGPATGKRVQMVLSPARGRQDQEQARVRKREGNQRYRESHLDEVRAKDRERHARRRAAKALHLTNECARMVSDK